MATQAQKTNDEIKQLKKQVAELSDQLKEKESQLTKGAHKVVENGKETVLHSITGLASGARGAYDTARDKVTHGYQQAHDAVESHPFESTFIALGVGAAVGAALSSYLRRPTA